MKKSVFSLGICLLALAGMASCGKSDDKAEKAAPKAKASQAAPGTLPNYRFIDSDTIMMKYNLSIDFNEQMIRLQNSLADEEKRQRASLQSRAAALQKKMEAATSQSEAESLRSEYESIQKQQAQAEQKLTQMGMDIEKTLATNAQVVMDSLQNFLKDYATARGYDAVLVKNCAPYFNPALDVTDEVVEGLNARYNKVKK